MTYLCYDKHVNKNVVLPPKIQVSYNPTTAHNDTQSTTATLISSVPSGTVVESSAGGERSHTKTMRLLVGNFEKNPLTLWVWLKSFIPY